MHDLKKIQVAVVYGGRSGEHDISLRSAKCIIDNIDTEKFDVIPVGIDREGQWFFNKSSVISEAESLAVQNGESIHAVPHADPTQERYFDVIFPVLHGKWGEDGTLQGLLEMTDIPYVGCGVLSSAICMDKDISKRLVSYAGIKTVDYFVAYQHQSHAEILAKAQQSLKLPVFVKPANAGSSDGVTKVNDWSELQPALASAFVIDPKILIEQGCDVRDIELSVLQAKDNSEPLVSSIAGEVINTKTEFYSKAAKYDVGYFPQLVVPADVTTQQLAVIQQYAKTIFTVLECRGLARIDFFIDKNSGEVIFNEVNTMPGFTSMSLYPVLWQHSGLSYQELLTHLIEIALDQ